MPNAGRGYSQRVRLCSAAGADPSFRSPCFTFRRSWLLTARPARQGLGVLHPWGPGLSWLPQASLCTRQKEGQAGPGSRAPHQLLLQDQQHPHPSAASKQITN